MDLKFVIQTVLQGEGITATAEQLRQVEQQLLAVKQAGNDTQAANARVTDAFKGLADQQGKSVEITDEQREKLKEAAFWTLHYQVETDKAGRSVRQTSRSVEDFSRAAGGAKEAAQGLAQGGIGGVISAIRGAINVIRSLSTAVSGVVGVMVAAVGGAVLWMRARINSNSADIQRYYAEAAKAAEDYQERLAAGQAVTAEILRAQRESVQALAREYEELLGLIDAAEKRTQGTTSARRAAENARLAAEEQTALADAAPSERDAVRRTFARRREDLGVAREREDLTNVELSAFTREKAATETQAAARAQLDSLSAQLREAQAAAAEALARTQQFAPTDASPEAQSARNLARVRRDQVDSLEAQRAVQNEAALRARRELDAVAETRAQLPFRQQALDFRASALATARGREDRDAEIQRREAARQAELQGKADVTGVQLEDIFSRALKSPQVANDKLAPTYQKIVEAAQAIQGEASGEELAQLAEALQQLVDATKGRNETAFAEIRRLNGEVKRLAASVAAIKLNQ